jgi:hypothetical protein
MLEPTRARDLAMAEAHDLAEDEFWRPAFENAEARVPVLVKNLTDPRRDYYLVDFRKGTRPTGRMVIDPEKGNARQVSGIEYKDDELPEFIPPNEVISRLPPDIVLEDGRRIPRGTGTPQIEVVWEHTLESRTKFQPFYQLRWPERTLFWRIDGKFFDKLTPSGPKRTV